MALANPHPKQLSVSAIRNGTVIDHIYPGKALKLVEFLHLMRGGRITIGINLPSRRMGRKDLIKVEECSLTAEQTCKIAIFSPKATISLIRDYEKVEKYTVQLPELIHEGVCCPEKECITNHEPCRRAFSVEESRKEVLLTCQFCGGCFKP